MKRYIFLLLFLISCSPLKSISDDNIYYLNKNTYINIQNDKISGNSGVNYFNANLKKVNDEIKIDSIAMTKMASTDEEMNFIKTLKNVRIIKKEDNKIKMITKDNRVLEFFNKDILENRKYVLKNEKYKGLDISINFKNDTIFGYSGVNNYNAKFEINNSKLEVFDMAITLRASADDKIMELEMEFLSNLSNNKSISIKENELVLLSKNNKKLVFYLEK